MLFSVSFHKSKFRLAEIASVVILFRKVPNPSNPSINQGTPLMMTTVALPKSALVVGGGGGSAQVY